MAIVRLNLNHRFRFFSDILEIILEPAIEFNSPIHSTHVWIGFASITAPKRTMSVGLIWIIVCPLSRNCSSIDASISHQLIGWKGVVWINVPVLQPPDEIDASTIVFENIWKMTTLVPIIVPFCATKLSKSIGRPRVEWTNKVI